MIQKHGRNPEMWSKQVKTSFRNTVQYTTVTYQVREMLKRRGRDRDARREMPGVMTCSDARVIDL